MNHAHSPVLTYDEQLKVLPIVHDRVVYSQLLHRQLSDDSWHPDVVAVELAPSFKSPMLEGIGLGDGPIWISQGLKESMEVFPRESLSGFRNTRRMVHTVQRTLLELRSLASRQMLGGAEMPARWTENVYVGFEPVVFLFEPPSSTPTLSKANIATPDRRYHYSIGFYKDETPLGPRHFCRPTLGRAWVAPPVDPEGEAERLEWLDAGHGGRLPSATTGHALSDSMEDWDEALVDFALSAADDYVTVVSRRDEDALGRYQQQAARRGKQVVHVDLGDLSKARVRTIRRNEYGPDPSVHSAPPDPIGEVVALHSGDAIIEAVRWATKSGKGLEFIDREILESSELRELHRRPETLPHDDSLIHLRGLAAHYEALQLRFESSRIALDGERERVMAGNLRRLLAGGHHVLFVCGMAHWGHIKALLDAGGPVVQPVDADGDGSSTQLMCAGSLPLARAWADPPRVVSDFMAARKSGNVDRFSYAASAAGLQDRIRARCLREGISLRRVLKFETMLERLTPIDGFASPTLMQFFEAGRSCLSGRAQGILLEEVDKTRGGCPDHLSTFSDHGIDAANAARVLASRWHGSNWLTLSPPTSPEEDPGDESDRHSWKPGWRTQPWWDRFVQNLHRRAYEQTAARLAQAFEQSAVVRGPLDIKRTIRARSQGSKRWVSRAPSVRCDDQTDLFEDFAPILFDCGIRPSDQWECLHIDDWIEGPVIGVGITRRRTEDTWTLSGLAVLAPSLRFAEEGRVRRWLEFGLQREPVTKAEVHRARHAVSAEGGRPLDALARLLIDCTDRDAIVVSDAQPGQDVMRRSRERRKRLHHLSPSRLAAHERETLKSAPIAPPLPRRS